ncbi:Oidioi.mRNA.OKI2018_I69.chr1.g1353.t1.cds [Oikopleura dioica]|uniref:Oidioi.mRNA.OKI2018_I69.chr1.g1353.t1.cds n=1 Tax=Oikopleura dioica TaxID=34765 RepID=A0ABN7SRW4_OIKDI|nr:Oidioi.mRNA.OKI2018_I69.chr1.g1353.t1.cds [Oikopleura dioica]
MERKYQILDLNQLYDEEKRIDINKMYYPECFTFNLLQILICRNCSDPICMKKTEFLREMYLDIDNNFPDDIYTHAVFLDPLEQATNYKEKANEMALPKSSLEIQILNETADQSSDETKKNQ